VWILGQWPSINVCVAIIEEKNDYSDWNDIKPDDIEMRWYSLLLLILLLLKVDEWLVILLLLIDNV